MHGTVNASRTIIPASHMFTGSGPRSFMREKSSSMYDMTPLESPNNSGIYRTRNWFVDRFFFAETRNDAVTVGRTKAQAETGAGLVFLHRYLYGRVRGVMGDANIDRDPGQMYLMDQEQRVDCIQFPITSQGVFIPKDLIGYDPDRHPAFVRFADNKTVNALLYRAFDQVIEDMRSHCIVDWRALDQLIASLRYALGTDDRDGDVRRQARDAMADLIREHVERNLDQADLSSTSILKTFGLSRASLFRIFKSDGGVRRYINQRRLFRAVLDIARSEGARGSISQAAERWGFSSNANFNRAVRNQFHVSPSSLVNLPEPDLKYLGAADRVRAFAHQV